MGAVSRIVATIFIITLSYVLLYLSEVFPVLPWSWLDTLFPDIRVITWIILVVAATVAMIFGCVYSHYNDEPARIPGISEPVYLQNESWKLGRTHQFWFYMLLFCTLVATAPFVAKSSSDRLYFDRANFTTLTYDNWTEYTANLSSRVTRDGQWHHFRGASIVGYYLLVGVVQNSKRTWLVAVAPLVFAPPSSSSSSSSSSTQSDDRAVWNTSIPVPAWVTKRMDYTSAWDRLTVQDLWPTPDDLPDGQVSFGANNPVAASLVEDVAARYHPRIGPKGKFLVSGSIQQELEDARFSLSCWLLLGILGLSVSTMGHACVGLYCLYRYLYVPPAEATYLLQNQTKRREWV